MLIGSVITGSTPSVHQTLVHPVSISCYASLIRPAYRGARIRIPDPGAGGARSLMPDHNRSVQVRYDQVRAADSQLNG